MRKILIASISTAIVLTFPGCMMRDRPVVKAHPPLKSGKTSELTSDEMQVEQILINAAKLPIAADYFKNFFSTAYIIIEDFDNLCFTATCEENIISIKRGIDPSKQVDLVIPMSRENCEAILEILKDGKITDEEEYKIYCVTFIPSFWSIIQQDGMYDAKIQRFFNTPDFIHIILKNEKGFLFGGKKSPIAATIIRVDGQWMIFEGIAGDPDVRMEVTIEQVKKYTDMVKLASEAKTTDEQKKHLKALKALLDEITVYHRK